MNTQEALDVVRTQYNIMPICDIKTQLGEAIETLRKLEDRTVSTLHLCNSCGSTLQQIDYEEIKEIDKYKERVNRLEYQIQNLCGTIDELAGMWNDHSLQNRVSVAVYRARSALKEEVE